MKLLQNRCATLQAPELTRRLARPKLKAKQMCDLYEKDHRIEKRAGIGPFKPQQQDSGGWILPSSLVIGDQGSCQFNVGAWLRNPNPVIPKNELGLIERSLNPKPGTLHPKPRTRMKDPGFLNQALRNPRKLKEIRAAGRILQCR